MLTTNSQFAENFTRFDRHKSHKSVETFQFLVLEHEINLKPPVKPTRKYMNLSGERLAVVNLTTNKTKFN